MSDGLTMGVEEEFLLVNPRTGRTTQCAEQVYARHRHHGTLPGGASVQRELRPTQLELATGVCVSGDDVREHLVTGRRILAAAAAAEDCALLATGTPIGGGPARCLPGSGRYGGIDEAYGVLASDYEACGCHVHIGVPDTDTAVAVVNHLGRWLPTLLALSANSPSDHGVDSGYHSWRTVLQSRFPGSGVAPYFRDHTAYRKALETIVDCGALIDPDQTFWLARPSGRFPTVELRAADTTLTVDEAVLQALLSRALVRTALDDLERGREAEPLDPQVCAAAVWTASRHGLTGSLIDPLRQTRVPARAMVDTLLEHVRPALGTDLPEVSALLATVLEDGTGSERQRTVAADGKAALLRFLTQATVPALTLGIAATG